MNCKLFSTTPTRSGASPVTIPASSPGKATLTITPQRQQKWEGSLLSDGWKHVRTGA
jgi:hypothetical protein